MNDPLSESFYNVNNGSSIITSKVSHNLSNENKNTGVSVVFKAKRELKRQKELFLYYHFSGNTSASVFITEIIWRTFEVIIDNHKIDVHSRKTWLLTRTVQIIEGFASFAINALGKKVQRCMTDLICFVSIESVIPEMFCKATP